MHDEHIEEFAQSLFKEAWDAGTDEQRASAKPEVKEAYLQRQREYGRKVLATIMDKRALYIKHSQFHPSNTQSRQLFFRVTGIKLPKGATATYKAIDDYIGEDTIIRIKLERHLEELEKTRKVFLREEEENRAHLERINRCIREDKGIDGGDLLFMCRTLNIDVPLRTQGYMLKSLVSIASSTSRVLRKKGQKAADMHQWYRQVVKRLNSVPMVA